MSRMVAGARIAGWLGLAALATSACGGLITPTPSPSPAAQASPTSISPIRFQTSAPASTPVPATPTMPPDPTPSPTPAVFPSQPQLPSGWAWRSDEAKTFRMAVPSDFVFVRPADFFKDRPDNLTGYGAVGVFQDPRIADRAVCTPDIRVYDLSKGTVAAKMYGGGNGKGIASYEALVSYATNAQTVDPYPHGQQIVSASPISVHQGYAAMLHVVEPPNDKISTNGYHDVLWAVAPDGVWLIDGSACGDAAWGNLQAIYETMATTFEAPIPAK
jgi:hypothetical protein